tara:strand:- start:724 stop:2667 length:1944 start_codon:yes stop_codon:yes gene_type:complete
MKTAIWEPSDERKNNSQMMDYIHFINKKFSFSFTNYDELYNWSINKNQDFWLSFWEYSKVIEHKPCTSVVDDIKKMPRAKWFDGCTLNFAENLLRFRDNKIAIQFYREDGPQQTLTYNQLYLKVSHLASSMRKMGVLKGDRVAGFLPNVPESVVAMLATTSMGAVWSSCSPDFGIKGAIDRFEQISPKLLFASDEYYYNGKKIDCINKVKNLCEKINSIEKTIIVSTDPDLKHFNNLKFDLWENFIDNKSSEIVFESLPFNHPLYIMYSSGTTGKPKSIVHSLGGTLIQHLKELQLHTDIEREDTVFYYTTCGWMMWNWLISSLGLGATIVLYDGSPFFPSGEVLIDMIDELGITVFGTSAKYISALESANISPKKISKFSSLRTILSTGSPLVEKNFDFVYSNWKSDVQLSSISGGTDIISCFALGNPLLPVFRGEIQSKGLGMNVESFDEKGRSVLNETGELVCTSAFPSMPIYFWNDDNGQLYNSAYFSKYKDVWHHGDLLEINDHGGMKIHGRSDTILNPGGVRIGTSEIYQAVDVVNEIEDSIVVGHYAQDDERIILFVKLKKDLVLNNELKNKIVFSIKESCTNRHVPSKIFEVDSIPYTLSGKKVELAVRHIINGDVLKNKESIANPESLEQYKKYKIKY